MIKDLIAKKHYATDKFTSHSYLDSYESVLAAKKDTALNVLEIGVSKGGSILLWRDYFEKAQIYGLDVEDMPEDIVNDSKERINIIKANAYDEKFIKENFINKGIKFDFLIDDGPHLLPSMQFFATHYSMLMAPGAIMIIEDIPILEWGAQIISCFPKNVQSKARTIDLRSIQNRWDDIIVVLET